MISWRMAEPRLRLRLFDKALHDRGAFSSGVEKMDRWLRESIGEQIRQNRLRVWCATDPDGAFVGYYALAMHSVIPGEAPNLAGKRERHPIPAIYLSALAVQEAHQGKGIGGALLGDAVLRSIRISDEIGAAAIVLDVLDDANYARRRVFYTALGFAEIGNGDPGRLYLSIRDAKASAEAIG
jgi:GNAT superfamily N-acetyltransferase